MIRFFRRPALAVAVAALALPALAACGGAGGEAAVPVARPAPAVGASGDLADVTGGTVTPAAAPFSSTRPGGTSSLPPPSSTTPPSTAPASTAPATARPRPSTSSSPPAVPREPVPDFGIPVRVGRSTQVITVKAVGTHASVQAWQKYDGTWKRVHSGSGRVGANGVTDGATRRQGTSTTPSGTYPMTRAFGIKPDPGTRLPHTRIGADHWWVQDNTSRYYNQMRLGSQGGFDSTSPEDSTNGSERLALHVPAYHHAIVIDYNVSPAVRYRGAGIFLHVNGSGPTAGCVSVPEADMEWLMRWVDPQHSPVIAIA